MNRYKRNSRKMVAYLQNRDLKGVQSCVRRKLGIKKFFRIFKNKNVLFKLAYYHVYSKKPIQENTILFETFMAKNYSDSLNIYMNILPRIIQANINVYGH